MSFLVALDNGHGKSTPGKRSFDESFFEYEFNRYVVSRIKYHLERHGVKVVLTAPTDIDTPLGTRCKVADNMNVDILVSVHANAFGETWNTASGWEVFYSKGSTKGQKLAECIHEASIPFLGLKDRGIKTTTGFTMCVRPKAPSVLIEHFFFTNKTELLKCNTKAFREKFAIADAKGILNYFGIKWEKDDAADRDLDFDLNLVQKVEIKKGNKTYNSYIIKQNNYNFILLDDLDDILKIKYSIDDNKIIIE